LCILSWRSIIVTVSYFLRFDQGGGCKIGIFYLEKWLIIVTVDWFQKDAVERIIVTVLYLIFQIF